VPFQHASRRILRLMKRPANAEDTLERIRRWRAVCPELTIRSTFIAGFPGETESEFEELLAFLREAQLDRVGCFAYSPVDGAAANALPDPVPEEVKEERRARLMQLQAGISAARLRGKVGKRIKVLVDAPGAGTIQRGRTGNRRGRPLQRRQRYRQRGICPSHDRALGRARSLRETGMSTREVVVVSGARTGIGDYGGSLKDFAPTKLGAIAIKEAVARAKIDPASVGHVGDGQRHPRRSEGHVLSRVAAIDAGLPVGTPCLTVNRLCGSGLQAIVSAAQHILLGDTGLRGRAAAPRA
jgi:hypothetical protein